MVFLICSIGLYVCLHANIMLFYYCSFLIKFEIKMCDTSNFIFPPEDYCGYLGQTNMLLHANSVQFQHSLILQGAPKHKL